jgi:hypothetical protein
MISAWHCRAGAYQKTLKEWTRERVPLDWARTQLTELGRRQADTAKFEAAVAAFQEALKVWTAGPNPLLLPPD